MKLLGAILIATPFVWFTVHVIRESDWQTAAKVWGFTVAMTGIVATGAFLLSR